MLTSIRLQNFKGHRDTTVPLGRFTVLVGPNGTGKTSVLQALELLSQLTQEAPHHVLRADLSPFDLRNRASGAFPVVSVAGTGQHFEFYASVQILPPTVDPNARISAEWSTGDSDLEREQGVQVPLKQVWESPLTEMLGSSVLYRFDARAIASVSFSAEESPAVENDGGNTAVALAAMKLEREEAFAQVEAELRKIVPNILRVRVRRIKVEGETLGAEPKVGNKVFLDFKGAADVPAHAASEGTLVTLALLTALCSPTRPRILLLDDIDQSLHPQAQAQLVRELLGLLKSFPEVQIVATTHSPYVLDELDPSEVLVFAPREEGGVACRRLSEHPQASQLKGMLTAGQLWTLDPESRWVVGGG